MRACVSEERENGEGAGSRAGSQVLPLHSDTLRYLNLTDLTIGLVALRDPMHLCACVREDSGDGEGVFFGLFRCWGS